MFFGLLMALALVPALSEAMPDHLQRHALSHFQNSSSPLPQPTCQSDSGLCGPLGTVPSNETSVRGASSNYCYLFSLAERNIEGTSWCLFYLFDRLFGIYGTLDHPFYDLFNSVNLPNFDELSKFARLVKFNIANSVNLPDFDKHPEFAHLAKFNRVAASYTHRNANWSVVCHS
ncbi:hypothetical protein EsH8_X_000151 [Colletotrichum jinshuiense]